jgi:hypothetical protein
MNRIKIQIDGCRRGSKDTVIVMDGLRWSAGVAAWCSCFGGPRSNAIQDGWEFLSESVRTDSRSFSMGGEQ